VTSCLIIDADEESRRLASEVLGGLEFEVVVAAQGQAGLEEYLRQPTDLVLLDLDGGDSDGLGILPELVRGETDCRVIAVSRQAELDLALCVLRQGAADFLAKPLSAKALIAAVGRALTCLTSARQLTRWSDQLKQAVVQRTEALSQARESDRLAREDLARTHEAVRRARQALIEREKLASFGLLAAGVAHEINNPLGFVNSNLTVLEDYTRSLRRLAAVLIHARSRMGAGKSEAGLRLLAEASRVVEDEKLAAVIDDLGPLFDEVRNGLARITSIVEKLRLFSEAGPSDGVGRLDLNAEAQRLIELVQGSGSRALEVRCVLEPLPVIQLPVMGVRQLLLNLFGYFARRPAGSGTLMLRTAARPGQVELELTDPQAGLDAQELAGLFDPMASGAGALATGKLGLAVARVLAESMGGRLDASRASPTGVCVRLMLPALGLPSAVEGRAS
jgi:DNA-binding response OmpR family regulator